MTSNTLDIILVDDEEIIHSTVADYLTQLGHHVDNAYHVDQAIELCKNSTYHLALVDIRMPGKDGFYFLNYVKQQDITMAIVMITGHGNMELAVQALRAGSADFLTKPIKLLELDATIEKIQRLVALTSQTQRLSRTIGSLQNAQGRDSYIGRSESSHFIRSVIAKAAQAHCETILIYGETGTGKEVVARAIHFESETPSSPFIAVSCPSLPENLVESELFGHQRGSFTGAVKDKIGYFEMANNGTLFLDEVADLSLAAQAKILRALETRSINRVGSVKPIDISVRIITATNTSLQNLVSQQLFRQDLMYRLNVFTIELPPLRERVDDIFPLAQHFISQYCKQRGLPLPSIHDEAYHALLKYKFPGNIRELRNIIERAIVLCNGKVITLKHLALEQNYGIPLSDTANTQAYDDSTVSHNSEYRNILAALEQTKWNRKAAAKLLHMPYSTLRYKIKLYQIT